MRQVFFIKSIIFFLLEPWIAYEDENNFQIQEIDFQNGADEDDA